MDYLGRYIQRTALSERSIVSCDEQRVSFRYRDHRDGQQKTMTLPAGEFLRRYLQHVLPRGMHRVRSFGFLHPSQRRILRRLQLLLGPPPTPRPLNADRDTEDVEANDDGRCETCGASRWVHGPRLTEAACLAAEVALSKPTQRGSPKLIDH